MSTITKKELIDRIADSTQAKRVVVKRIIQSFLDEVIVELAKENRLEFRDFGIFETRTRAAREAQNASIIMSLMDLLLDLSGATFCPIRCVIMDHYINIIPPLQEKHNKSDEIEWRILLLIFLWQINTLWESGVRKSICTPQKTGYSNT